MLTKLSFSNDIKRAPAHSRQSLARDDVYQSYLTQLQTCSETVARIFEAINLTSKSFFPLVHVDNPRGTRW